MAGPVGGLTKERPFKAVTGVLVLFFLWLGGCAPIIEGLPVESTRIKPITVLARSDIEKYVNGKLGVFPFQGAHETAAGASEGVGSVYYGSILQRNVFRRIVYISQPVRTEEQALWWGRREGCDLVMMGNILYLLDGTGAMQTNLELEIRILDTHSGRLAWYVQQGGASTPGHDVDFTWTTISGDPARRFGYLAGELAGRFAEFLVEPMGK
ncbi:MAG: hypothetical protein ACLGPL_08720 [Acidobacteriota bacterium]